MDWLKIISALLKAKDIKDKVDEVDKLKKYADKVSKSRNPSWNDLKYFNNKQMDAAIKGAKASLKEAEAALSARHDWPDSDSSKLFLATMKAADRHGHDSKQARAALDTYRKELLRFEKDLKSAVAELAEAERGLEAKQSQAEALRDYANVLEDAFMKCAKIPSLTGTAQNAMFFGLSQDAGQLAGIGSSLARVHGKLAGRARELERDGKELIRTNAAWIAWSGADALRGPDVLKRNQKAETPR